MKPEVFYFLVNINVPGTIESMLATIVSIIAHHHRAYMYVELKLN